MNPKKITIIFIILVGMLLAVFVPYQRTEWGKIDFLPYWSSSKTLFAGGNPYNPNDLFLIQKDIRSTVNKVSDVDPAWGPPWTMVIISPLILLNFETAVRFWIFLNVVMLTLAIYLLWKMLFPRHENKSLILALAVGFLFGNTVRLIELGQFSAILLIAFVLMIWCLEREYYLLAGIAVTFLTIKPQITFLALAVVFVWALRSRTWRIFYGFIASGLILLTILWIIFPNWFLYYINTVISIPNIPIYYSTIGSFIESIFGLSIFKYIGLLLIPLALPLSKSVEKTGWLTILNLALLISIPFAPYGFSFDHVLLLPAIMQMVSWMWYRNLPVNNSIVIGAGIVICYSFVYFLMSIPSGLPYYWLVLPTIGLVIIYLFAWWKIDSEIDIPGFS